VAGEFFKTVALGFRLRPRGLKQIVEVEVEIRNSAHVKIADGDSKRMVNCRAIERKFGEAIKLPAIPARG
jgi:hypothetical protein